MHNPIDSPNNKTASYGRWLWEKMPRGTDLELPSRGRTGTFDSILALEEQTG